MAFFRIILAALLAHSVYSEDHEFDPNNCYGPGTIFELNEKNLGFCPCKYGFTGPDCFEVFDCVIGEISTQNCSQDIPHNDYDLQWRCGASDKEIVKICRCPDGYRGETCEYILENTFSAFLDSVKQSQRFFEIIQNKKDSVIILIVTAIYNSIMKCRRLIMALLFFAILQLAWRFTKKQKARRCRNPEKCQKSKQFFENSSNFNYALIRPDVLEKGEGEKFTEKKKFEEDSCSVFTQCTEVSEVSEVSENRNSEEVSNENSAELIVKTIFHKPTLHI